MTSFGSRTTLRLVERAVHVTGRLFRSCFPLALVALSVALAGCTGQSPEPSPTAHDDFVILVDSYLNSDAAETFDAEQVDVLTDARSTGLIAFEDYAAAIDRSLDCMDSAGIHTEKYAADDSRGFPVLDYFYESPETGNPVAEECLLVHSAAIEAVYQLQPTSIEAENAVTLERVPALIACLDDLGVDHQMEGLSAAEIYPRFGKLLLEASEVSEDYALAVAACDTPQ